MVIITAKQQQKLDAKKQLTSVGKIAQMTVAQSFMFFFLHDRVQRGLSVIIQQLDFILNFGTIFKQFKSDDFMEVVGKLAFYDAEKEQKNKNKLISNIISLVINTVNVLRILTVMAKDQKALIKGRVFVDLLLALLSIVIKAIELVSEDEMLAQFSLMSTGFKLIIALYEMNQGQVQKLKHRVAELEEISKKQQTVYHI
ncbi:hypothetical protein TYRP_022463 [Tyrophagus putrescentiae]|nr:hypothetical protein TYRP_022463 [Tyrophagus putrescentiae]